MFVKERIMEKAGSVYSGFKSIKMAGSQNNFLSSSVSCFWSKSISRTCVKQVGKEQVGAISEAPEFKSTCDMEAGSQQAQVMLDCI